MIDADINQSFQQSLGSGIQTSSNLDNSMYNSELSIRRSASLIRAQIESSMSSQDESSQPQQQQQYPLQQDLQILEGCSSSDLILTPFFEQMPFEEQISINTLRIPSCYQVVVPQLTTSLFKRFEATILFYLFYNYPYDQVQIDAYNELVNRGWQLHKKTNRWFIQQSSDD